MRENIAVSISAVHLEDGGAEGAQDGDSGSLMKPLDVCSIYNQSWVNQSCHCNLFVNEVSKIKLTKTGQIRKCNGPNCYFILNNFFFL